MPIRRLLLNPECEPGGGDAREDLVTIARSELEALRSRAVSDPSAGSAEDLAARERRIEDRERLLRDALRDRELAIALAGRPLVGGAADQLIKLWKDDYDVVEDGVGYRVVSRDGRPLGKSVAERLASPDYAHFCLPASRGGTGSRAPQRETPAVTPPRTLGEAVIAEWRAAGSSRAGDAPPAIGLGRRR